MSATDEVAIVGVGATPYYFRGESYPQTITELAGKAILAACEDAGISVTQIDGFAYYSEAGAGYGDKMDTATFMETLGIPEVTFSAALTSGGGGSAGSIGLPRAAILAGDATHVVTVMALQQRKQRLGTIFGASAPSPQSSFLQPSGLVGPGHLMSVLTRRHMHLYGTRREAFAEIAMSSRENALDRPNAQKRTPLTSEEYFGARMIAEPLCLFDFCLETDGAVAVVTTSLERARDLRHPPARVVAAAHGGRREWGRAFAWYGMLDPYFASSGHAPVAEHLYRRAGVGPADIDVALIYDHFSPMVLMQLEDYGFCARGEGGPFVESGAIRYHGGSIPVNTHGGQLSEAYIIGMTHVKEAVEQIRGTAINQVARGRARARHRRACGAAGQRPDPGGGAMSAVVAQTLPPESIRITTDSWTEPFWLASRDERLVAPRCAACGAFRLPPTPFCPECQSQAVEWVELSGRATVFSYSIVRGLPEHPEPTLVPVVLELAGAPGVHLVSNAVDVDPDVVRIGTTLEVGFVEIADGWKLPVFRPAEGDVPPP